MYGSKYMGTLTPPCFEGVRDLKLLIKYIVPLKVPRFSLMLKQVSIYEK